MPSISQRGSSSTPKSTTARATSNSSSTASPAATAATTTTTASTTTPKSSESGSANIKLSDLHNVLSGLPSAAGGSSGGPNVDLSAGLTSEVLQPLLENEEFVRRQVE